MAVGLLGRKVGMTQIFDKDGKAVPVTVIAAGPCTVLQLRTADRDGYDAVQLGFGERKRRLVSRADRGQVARLDSKRSKRRSGAGVELLARADCEPPRFVREFRGPVDGYEVGKKLTVEVFREVKSVDVTGTSKGRGFAGVMKRHGFSGQRATHGVKKVHRQQGSTGQNTSPARVWRGKRMSGHYGNERVTTRNLKVAGVDAENNLLLIYGGVPGPNGSYVTIRQTNMSR